MDLSQLLDSALKIDPDLEVRDYSGRGMFGRKSDLAFDSYIHPRSIQGSQLTELGFTYDNMGKDFVYYLR